MHFLVFFQDEASVVRLNKGLVREQLFIAAIAQPDDRNKVISGTFRSMKRSYKWFKNMHRHSFINLKLQSLAKPCGIWGIKHYI